MTRKASKKQGAGLSAAEIRAESKRRRRELGGKLKVLKAELALALARVRKTFAAKVADERRRVTTAYVRKHGKGVGR